ncbi:hypothetical protein [Azospirillum sp.]|uniref:hypothetical protein n=1 Tax=Azospirillum sp. TaxID=34012 RepID=UPI002D678053|nr:hypothetical protein [Azospirillum sp.]HYD66114.1 hypothetical protein [Azospirillum sp.]
MGGESHDGVVAFQPLTLGREAVMLGRVQVGEIMPTDGGRHQACFRLTLPEASTSAAWRPARDLAEARRLACVKINDWLNAADLRPNGGC